MGKKEDEMANMVKYLAKGDLEEQVQKREKNMVPRLAKKSLEDVTLGGNIWDIMLIQKKIGDEERKRKGVSVSKAVLDQDDLTHLIVMIDAVVHNKNRKMVIAAKKAMAAFEDDEEAFEQQDKEEILKTLKVMIEYGEMMENEIVS